MTKSELISAIAAQSNVKCVYLVEGFANEPTYNNVEPAGSTTAKYLVHLLEADDASSKAYPRSIQIYVYNEGQADEIAYRHSRAPEAAEIEISDAVKTAIVSYVENTLGTTRYTIDGYSKDQKYALVTVWETNTTEAAAAQYYLFHDGTAIAHRRVVSALA